MICMLIAASRCDGPSNPRRWCGLLTHYQIHNERVVMGEIGCRQIGRFIAAIQTEFRPYRTSMPGCAPGYY